MRLLAVSYIIIAWTISTPLSAEESVEVWIQQLASSERDERREAAHALARLGPDAVEAGPALAIALSDKDSQVWQEATNALASLGPAAEPALNALLERMDSSDEQRRYRTAFALGRIGTAAIPSLRQKVYDQSRNSREVAVSALGFMNDEAVDAVPDLITRLGDDDEVVREVASDSLQRIGSPAVGQLVKALEHERAYVRTGAARAIQGIGPRASEAVNSLLKLTQDDNEPVRAASLEALASVEAKDRRVIRPLMQAIQDETASIQQAAINGLVSLSPKLKPRAASELSRLLKSQHTELVNRVAIVLSGFGPLAEQALPALLDRYSGNPNSDEMALAIGRIGEAALPAAFDALRQGQLDASQVARIIEGMPAQVREKVAMAIDDQSPNVRGVAALTIGRLIPLPKDATKVLREHLQDPDESVRIASARSLQRIGSKARGALPSLVEALQEEQVSAARVAMLETVAALETDTGRLVDLLVQQLQDGSAEVRQTALKRLGEQEQLPSELHSELQAFAADSAPAIRAAAVLALARLSGKADDTIPLLIDSLADPVPVVREQGLLALAKLGAAARDAVPTIQDQLRDESATIRIAAVESLAGIGAAAEPAFDHLAELTSDEHPDVRAAVVKNLSRITQEAEKLLAIYVRSLEDEEWSVRRYGAEQLGKMEEEAAPAVPALLELLRREDDSDAARRALRSINTAGEEAVPILLDILQDDSAGRLPKYYSLYLLRQMGSKAQAALPTLKELSAKADGRQRDYLDRAIREIEGENQE